jgi:hypothetical protein
VFTHAWPHIVVDEGQAQAPAAHARPAEQATPHLPQSVALVWVSTQDEPHKLRPAGHVQAPTTHELPLPHALPHAPQLALSVTVSTHTAPHAVLPCGQAPALPSLPALASVIGAAGTSLDGPASRAESTVGAASGVNGGLPRSAATQRRRHSIWAAVSVSITGIFVPHAGLAPSL